MVRSKLSDADVADCRARYAAGQASAIELAIEYGVARSTMKNALRGAKLELAQPDPATARATAEGLLAGVRATLDALGIKDRDRGVAALVELYAQRIMDAEALADIAAEVRFPMGEKDGYKQLRLLQQKVAAVTVMADLGPKLQLALETLGASPKAAAAIEGKAPAAPPDSAKARLTNLRSLHGGRKPS